MIIIMKESASAKEIESVEKLLAEFGFQTHPIQGEKKTVIGAIGDKRLLSMNQILTMDGVENVVPIMKPYKLASKELHKEPSVIEIGHGITVGGKQLAVFAGPCAIESQEQFTTVSKAVKASGANILRGGAFKPRSSPYSFQGLEGDGLKIMYNSGQELNMPICTEVLDTRDVELVAKYADIMQIGARNMQNFKLLREVGKCDKPILLKRGLACTMEEWLMAAEYIMSEGNEKVTFVKEVSEHTKLLQEIHLTFRQFLFQRNFLIFLLLPIRAMQQVHISMFRLLQKVLLRQVLTVL